MRIHLITMVGHSITTLGPMLRHHANLGVDSFWIYLHEGDLALSAQVSDIAASFRNVTVNNISGDWLDTQGDVLLKMATRPDDWFLIVDQDEFQVYPADLHRLLEVYDDLGFDHVRGAYVDRVAASGQLPPVNADLPLWDQYPIGAFLTYPICGGDFRKVPAAKGSVRLQNGGHHSAVNGHPVPTSELLVQVHHFKWVGELREYLTSRRSPTSKYGTAVRAEAERFLLYFASHGNRIPLEEDALLAAPCDPDYKHWPIIRALAEIAILRNSIDQLYVEAITARRQQERLTQSARHPN